MKNIYRSLIFWIKRYINFFYDLLIRPRSLLPDAYRREFILNSLLVGSIILVLWDEANIVIGGSLQGASYQGVPMIGFTLIVVLFISLLALSRKGYSLLASYLFIGLYMLGTIYGSYRWGPDLPPVLFSYTLIIFTSGILFSGQVGFLVFLITGIVMLIISQLQVSGIVTPNLDWKSNPLEIRDVVQFIFMFFIITSVSWISNFEHERAHRRARMSEEALKEERDSLELKVEQRTEQLRVAQAEKMSQVYHFAEFGRLSSGLFHDLVGPLFSIANNIQHLSISAHPDLPAIREHLDLSIKASKRMEQFIRSLKHQIQMNDIKEIFSLNDIIEDVIALLHYKSTKAGVQIQFTADEKIRTYNNPIKFHQIISNLLSNAIDSYTDLDVPNRRKIVTIDLKLVASTIIITVRDRGCGIEPHMIDKIFDPFFTTKNQHDGMGLGLSNTKTNVEKCFNGAITVKSTHGQGSTFTITFPQTRTDTPIA